MPPDEFSPSRVRHVEIAEGDFTRWQTVGRRLEPVTPAVLIEISELQGDPCVHRLARVATAARYAAKIADEPLKTEAVALAEELEHRSQ